MEASAEIEFLTAFKAHLLEYEKINNQDIRSWINQDLRRVRSIIEREGCGVRLTIAPPPAVGGLIMRDIDPFDHIFERIYLSSMTPRIIDIIDHCIGSLKMKDDLKDKIYTGAAEENKNFEKNTAFIVMAINNEDHSLVDVLDGIKDSAKNVGILARRIDEEQSNKRITDRIMENIAKSQYVIVDITHDRPNVFFEAGYAHGLGKLPIYIARHGTKIHFDLKDYPVIFFRSIKELKDGISDRLKSLKPETT